MARTNTTVIYNANGNDSQGWYDRRKAHVLSGTQTIYQGQCFSSLPVPLPPRCKVLWARLSSQTTVPLTGGVGVTATTGTGSTPNGIAIIGWPTTATAPVTAPPTTASVTFANGSGTNGGVIAVLSSTASAQTARGAPRCECVQGVYGTNAHLFQNTNTTPAYLALVPIIATSSFVYQAKGTTAYQTNTTTDITFAGFFGTATASATSTNAYTMVWELYCEDFAEVS